MATKAKEQPASDNLAIWNALGKTDPRHTKQFSRAGGFKGTAIKPIWIIKMLTEQFGACGVGWGMDEPHFQVVPTDGEVLVFCTVACWHGSPENKLYGVGGDKVQAKRQSGSFCDDEAFKKAFTDAVGNAFKFVGVGADVHMGQFDDSKYVAAVAKEFSEQPANDGNGGEEEPAAREQLEGKHSCKTKLKAALKECHLKVSQAYSTRELDAIVKEYAADIKQGIRYLPKWISGDPEIGSTGLEAHVTNRRAVLGLVDSFRECSTKAALDNWFGANEGAVEALDDIQRKDFDRAYEEHEAGLQLVAAHQ